MISIIAAVGPNGELGKDNQLVYDSKEDMRFFQKTTLDHKVVMGLNTFNSIGKPLKNRENYVVAHTAEDLPVGVVHIVDFQKFLKAFENTEEEIFICGGASIYTQALPYASNLYLTEFTAPREYDVRFPDFDKSLYEQIVVRHIPGGVISKYVRK